MDLSKYYDIYNDQRFPSSLEEEKWESFSSPICHNSFPHIYAIRCFENNKIYIGRDGGKTRRLQEHRLLLRNKKHSNSRMQNSYNKYGESSFQYQIIIKIPEELVGNSNLIENAYIKLFQSFVLGFNILEFSESVYSGYIASNTTRKKISNSLKGGKRSEETRKKMSGRPMPEYVKQKLLDSICKPFEIMSPSGEIVKGTNINKFARENGLSGSKLNNVINGNRNHHKGWKLPNRKLITRHKDFCLVSPDGDIIRHNNIKNFAEQLGLNRNCFWQLINGISKSYKGWMKYSPEMEVI